MNKRPKIAILLPTYNGDKFLEEQLNSLLQQKYNNYIIVTRDDGSSDDTKNIINQYKQQHPDLFHIVDNNGINYGASKHFSFLMEYSIKNKVELQLPSCYIMFCDQDDIWHKDKILLCMDKMQVFERNQPNKPFLVHTDLRVIDQNKKILAKSFIKYQGLDISRLKFRHQLLSNTVTGCTALINEELLRVALPIPDSAIMHDWWLSLCSKAFGEKYFIQNALIDYRQHDANTIGAKEFKPLKQTPISILKRIFIASPILHFKNVADQADSFIKVYSNKLSFIQKIELRLVKKLDINHAFIQKLIYRILRKK